MSLKFRIQKLEAIKAKPLFSSTVIITMNGVLSPEDALLIQQAKIEGRSFLKINIASVSGNKCQ